MQLTRAEVDSGQLPPLCLRCGKPAAGSRDHLFTWHPDWLYLFLLPGIAPYFLVRTWGTRRFRARVPLCRTHSNRWRWRCAVTWTGAVVLLSMIAIGGGLAAWGRSVTAVITLLLGLVGLPSWFGIVFLLRRRSVRASAITPERVTLDGVSAEFADALQRLRAARGAEPELYRCTGCGLESPLLSAFQKGMGRLYCPRCVDQRHLRLLKRVLLVELAVGGLGLVLVLAGSAAPAGWELRSGGWLLVNLCLLALTEPLVIVPHEAGHTLMAWLVWARVFRVWIGSGRTVAECRLGGLPVEFKPIPLGGGTVFGFPTTRLYRTRLFLVVVAGPMTHVGLLGVLALAVPPGRWFAANFVTEFAPVAAFVVANLIVLGVNLLPFQVHQPGGPLASDGLTLLTLPFTSRAAIEKAQALYCAMEGAECLKAGQFDRAVAWYEAGIKVPAEEGTNRLNLGVALLLLGQLRRARQEWLAVLTAEDLSSQREALLRNNVAVADILIDWTEPGSPEPGVDLLAEADQFSAQALATLPWMPNMRGTRGSVLIAQGQIEEGRPLVEGAMGELERARDKAFCACFLARAAAQQGRLEEARAYVSTAETLDPQGIALPGARQALAGCQAALER